MEGIDERLVPVGQCHPFDKGDGDPPGIGIGFDKEGITIPSRRRNDVYAIFLKGDLLAIRGVVTSRNMIAGTAPLLFRDVRPARSFPPAGVPWGGVRC